MGIDAIGKNVCEFLKSNKDEILVGTALVTAGTSTIFGGLNYLANKDIAENATVQKGVTLQQQQQYKLG